MNNPTVDLIGKKAVILGVANDRSLAWGIAKKLSASGAVVGICFGDQSNQKRVVPLASEISASFVERCDVTSKADILNLKEIVSEQFGEIDILVHSIGFAPPEDLSNDLYKSSKDGFLKTMEISVFSLLELISELKPLLKKNASILTMTNHGSQKVIPGYGLMGVAKASLETAVKYLAYELGNEGIRVNAISAGPVKTISAMGVNNFDHYLDLVEEKSPLRRNITIEDVGNLSLFLSSDLSKNITGGIHYVDSGIQVMGS